MDSAESSVCKTANILPQLHAAMETIAATEHDRWTNWQQHLHAKFTR
jgi:hypothetical protein